MLVVPGRLRMVTTVFVLCCVLGYAAGHLAVMSIDLGSEYMKIAIVKPGVPMEIATNDDSARKTASIVAIRNGERMFGNAAENAATRFPSSAFWYLTHIVGKKFDDPGVQQYRTRFPYFNLVKDEERGTVLFQVDEETQHTPEELLAMQLEKGRQYAETFADQPMKDAVITVPSYYTQAERRAVLLAAELAGINVLQLMGDNAAVALNYGVFRRKQFTNVTQYIMFYDMGATSTTATIVGYQVVKMKEGTRVVENPQLAIKGVGFDKDMGGLEISFRLRDHMARHFHENKKTKEDLYSNSRAMAKLLKEAKRVKKVLSANGQHRAQVEGLLDDEDFRLKVTRAELEDLCSDMFEKVTKPIEEALKVSEITLGELTDVILMGGGTRIPKVQENILKYLGRTELGKSLNTDEAAAMGAVYQAAHLGKGFKVLPFGVKEANIYPLVVEFEKYRAEESSDPPKIIKRTLFGRMNGYPQKKVMTFNKHLKDFEFNVTYGDLDFLPEHEVELFKQLHGQLHNVQLRGVGEAYAKHSDAQESKGLKAHFRMDESGILSVEEVEAIFEEVDTEAKEESAWSKLGGTISGLFSSSDATEGQTDETTDKTEPVDTKEPIEPDNTGSEQNKSDPPGTDEPAEPDQTGSKPDDTGTDTGKSAEELGAEDEQTAGQTDREPDTQGEDPASDGQKDNKTDEGASDTEEKGDKDGEKVEKDRKDEDKKDKKTKDKEEKKVETEEDKKPKVKTVKENITVEMVVMDIQPPSKNSVKAYRKKLSDMAAIDKEKKLLEKSTNELEAFIFEMGDRLTREIYEKCSTEDEREHISSSLAEASDWLYDQDEETKKEAYITKLKELKQKVKNLEFRVKEAKDRPEALEALRSMLNHSQYFLMTIKNLSSIEEEPIFTSVDFETLEKLNNETEEWKTNMLEDQSKTPDYEKPKLLVEDIAFKLQALDREVKYLLHKAKTYRPKPKPKASKNKTEDKNETVIDSDTLANETKDSLEEEPMETGDTDETIDSTTTSDGVEAEIPAPPVDESPEEDEEPLQLVDGTEETEDNTGTTTEQPIERNTHNPEEL